MLNRNCDNNNTNNHKEYIDCFCCQFLDPRLIYYNNHYVI